jgi:hypothetical protein
MSRVRGAAGAELLELAAHCADSARLTRGRSIARHGQVGALQVEASVVRADVAGSRPEPYAVELRCRPAGAALQARLEDVAAVLVEGDELAARQLARGTWRPGLVDEAVAAGVALVPSPGDVSFSCTCPDWGEPCKHGVALLVAFAGEVDADGAALLRWRGLDGGDGSVPTTTRSAPDRPASVADLLSRLPSSVQRAGGATGAPERRPTPVSPPVAPAVTDPALDAFFTGSMPPAGPVLGRAGERLAGRPRSSPPFPPGGPFVVDGVDAAPVLADAVTVVADVLDGLL